MLTYSQTLDSNECEVKQGGFVNIPQFLKDRKYTANEKKNTTVKNTIT